MADVVDKGLKEPLQSSVAVAHIFETLARTKTISTTFLIDDIESLLSLSLYHTPLALGKDSTGFVPKRVPPRNLTVVRPLVDLLEEQGQTTASVVVSEGSHAKIGVFSKKHCSALIEIVTQPSAAVSLLLFFLFYFLDVCSSTIVGYENTSLLLCTVFAALCVLCVYPSFC